MAKTSSRFPAPNRRCLALGLAALPLLWGMVGSALDAGGEDVHFSVKVDKTAVPLGEPITLTLILQGDLSGVELVPPEFPDGVVVSGRSQSTNFAIRSGAVERSTSVAFVLIPQQVGTFRLGPFTLTRGEEVFQTETIEITVEKPSLPPPDLFFEGDGITL